MAYALFRTDFAY
jgi:hypothetical protein